MTMAVYSALLSCSLLLATSVAALTIDFEDVGATLPIDGNPYYDGADGTGGFTSGGAHFNNSNTGGFWSGFAYSQDTDTMTPGFENQYSAFPGAGAGGSATYAVGFQGITPTIHFTDEFHVVGVELANTTYAALAMRNGDAFARAFGTPPEPGDPGAYPDWFLLTIRGFDTAGDLTGVVGFYLADYRFEDDALDFVRDDWSFVDLGALGRVRSIRFELSGSDVGEFGLNTPAYFALDNLVVPEPGTLGLLGLGLGLTALARRGR